MQFTKFIIETKIKTQKNDNYVRFVIRHTALVSVLSRMTYVAASD